MDAITSRPATLLAAATGVAVASCVATLLLAGGAPPDLPVGMTDPGPVVGWGLRCVRLAGLLAGVLTIGSLLVSAGLSTRLESGRRALPAARRAATAWVATGVVGYVLSVCDIAGLPLRGVSSTTLLAGLTATAPAAQLIAAALAAVVAVASSGTGSPSQARALLVVGISAALPVPVVGHVAAAEDGGVSVSGLVVHVAAALVWTGGLAGLFLHLRTDRQALAVAVPRYSALALGAYLALTGSGLVAASAALPFTGEGWEVAWSSGYAGVVAAKVAVLIVLGALGMSHRRRSVPRILAGEPRSFIRLAAVELVVMSIAAGLATGLSHTPLPPRGGSDHAGTGRVDGLSFLTVLGTWRPNAVVLLALGLALAAYLHARRRLAATGQHWPRVRTGCFVASVILAALALCSSVVAYASLLLSLHLAQLLVMLLVVPPLLLLGRPLALSRAAYGVDLPGVILRLLASPATGAVASCLLLTVVYRTPLTVWSLQSPWWHLLVLAGAVACGVALMWPVLGEADQAAARRGQWAAWLSAVVACLAVLGVQLRTSDQMLAAAWFLELRLGWADPVTDQRLAGTLTVLSAGAMAVLGAAMLWRRPRRPQGHPDRPPPSPTGTDVAGTRPQPDQQPPV